MAAKKGTTKAGESGADENAESSGSGQTGAKDIAELIRRDHRMVEDLFSRFEAAQDPEPDKQGSDKQALVEQICRELIIHTQLEEEIFYPACRAQGVEHDDLNEAQVEHDAAKVLILDLLNAGADTYRDAKVKVLSEYIKHHVCEEEESEGILAKAEEAGVDMKALGERYETRKQELSSEAEAGRLGSPAIVSLHLNSNGQSNGKEHPMARWQNEHDREYGRGGQSRNQGEYGQGQYGQNGQQDWQRQGGQQNWQGQSSRQRQQSDMDSYMQRPDDRGGWRGQERGGEDYYGSGRSGSYSEQGQRAGQGHGYGRYRAEAMSRGQYGQGQQGEAGRGQQGMYGEGGYGRDQQEWQGGRDWHGQDYGGQSRHGQSGSQGGWQGGWQGQQGYGQPGRYGQQGGARQGWESGQDRWQSQQRAGDDWQDASGQTHRRHGGGWSGRDDWRDHQGQQGQQGQEGRYGQGGQSGSQGYGQQRHPGEGAFEEWRNRESDWNRQDQERHSGRGYGQESRGFGGRGWDER